MSIFLSRNERMYAQVTLPWVPTIPNSSGTATLANGDAVHHIRLELPSTSDIILSAAKTGALGRLAGIQGRRGGTWRATLPFQPSGTAGTVPDMDPILQAVFGKAPVVTPGTSVVYGLDDVMAALSLWSFLTPDNAQTPNRVAWGAMVQDFEMTTGDGELIMTAGGPLGYVIEEPNFSSYDTVAKAGLTAFPAEPATPTYTGNIIQAFVGSATINGVGTFLIESFTVRCSLNRRLRHPFASFYPTVPLAGIRDITLSFRLFMEDVAGINALRLLSHDKTSTFDATVTFGTAAGYICAFAFNNLSAPSVNQDDSGDEWIVEFAGAPASMTSSTAKDELTLTLT